MELPDKGLFCILGKSGSGKSTLLNLIGGLDFYDRGSIYFNNLSLKEMSNDELANYRNNIVGFVFQEYYLLSNLNVYDNIKLALDLQNKKEKNIDKLLTQLEILKLKNRKTKELSGGEQARVAIARALIKEPKIILADEPTGNLDEITSKEVWKIFQELSENCLVIIATHDEDNALYFTQNIIRINERKINPLKVTQNNKIINISLPDSKLSFNNIKNISFSIFKQSVIGNILLGIICFLFIFVFCFILNLMQFDLFKSHALALNENYKVDYNIKLTKKINTNRTAVLNYKNNELKKASNFLDENNYSYLKYASLPGATSLEFVNWASDTRNENLKLITFGSHIYLNSFNEIPENDFSKNYIGKLPENNDEILISNALADIIIEMGIYTDSNLPFFPNSYDDIINNNEKIRFTDEDFNHTTSYKIVGIYDLDLDLDAFKRKEIKYIYNENGKIPIYDEEINYFKENASIIYVKPGFFTSFEDKRQVVNQELYDFYLKTVNKTLLLNYHSKPAISKGLDNNEIIINSYILNLLTNNEFEKKYKNAKISEDAFAIQFMKENKINQITLTIKDEFGYSNQKSLEEHTFDIVGYEITPYDTVPQYYLSANTLKPYLYTKANIKTIKITETNQDNIAKILKYYDKDEKNIISTYLSDDFNSIKDTVNTVSNGSKYLALLFIILIPILLYIINIIMLTMNKKNVGILKALGVKDKNIIQIFNNLLLLITCIPFLIAIVLTPIGLSLANNYISELMGFKIKLINYKFYSLLIVFFTYMIGRYIVSKISYKKIKELNPVDIIRKKVD